MALIPGTLPADTCYGTPQDLLELFAQYLDIPAFALNSKVVFGTSSVGLTADVVWFDTTTATHPIMKITVSGGFIDYIQNYIDNVQIETVQQNDYVVIQDTSDFNKIKTVLAQGVANLYQGPSAGSITFPMLSGTSGSAANNVASRVAKAWVNFDGTNAFSPNPSTSAIRESFNVSSITDNSPGCYMVNFTTSMIDTNYVALANGYHQVTPPNDPTQRGALVSAYVGATTGVNVFTSKITAPATGADVNLIYVAVFR
jgi:hypothetical protein